MHIKHIHETIEKLSQYACEEACKNKESISTEELGAVVDMVKDLAEAEYYARISKAMEKEEKEEEEEIKYIMRKMKEEGEEGDENEARRFYRGQPRSQTSGRFMSRGDGRRSNRGRGRGYEEPMYYMMPEMYNPMEYYRDMDRMDGRMYYSGGNPRGNSGNSSGGSSGYSDGNYNMNRGYSEGGNSGGNSSSGDGNRGYSEGYKTGYEDGSRTNQKDYREGRNGNSRRSYMETKQSNTDNGAESKQKKMKDLEKWVCDLSTDVIEAVGDASQEEKNLMKQKLQVIAQKI